MQGTRIYPDVNGRLWPIKAGEYGQHAGTWYACTPNGLLGNLSSHEVEEHEDGTITVSPSILVNEAPGLTWHGFLRRGVWSEA